MSESKRNSIIGRIATPGSSGVGNMAARNLNDQDAAILKAIGGRIRVTTMIPRSSVIEGTLFTLDPITHGLAINSAPNPAQNTGSYHIVPVSLIKDFEIISLCADNPPFGFSDAAPEISPVSPELLKAREEAAIRKLKDYDETRGKGVTKKAQEIFDFFHRTLPVQWLDQSIMVNRSVVVDPPYTIDNIRAPKDKKQAVGQIKRVLEGYYSKKNVGKSASHGNNSTAVALNATGNVSRPVVPALPRKGG